METPTPKQPINLNQQYDAIVNWLSEIDLLQEDLEEMNNKLLRISANSSSEYGDYILEKIQKKVFYLQGILRNSTRALKEHQEVLKQVVEGTLSKSKKELLEYYDYCQTSASKIKSKLKKFKTETPKAISINRW